MNNEKQELVSTNTSIRIDSKLIEDIEKAIKNKKKLENYSNEAGNENKNKVKYKNFSDFLRSALNSYIKDGLKIETKVINKSGSKKETGLRLDKLSHD